MKAVVTIGFCSHEPWDIFFKLLTKQMNDLGQNLNTEQGIFYVSSSLSDSKQSCIWALTKKKKEEAEDIKIHASLIIFYMALSVIKMFK